MRCICEDVSAGNRENGNFSKIFKRGACSVCRVCTSFKFAIYDTFCKHISPMLYYLTIECFYHSLFILRDLILFFNFNNPSVFNKPFIFWKWRQYAFCAWSMRFRHFKEMLFNTIGTTEGVLMKTFPTMRYVYCISTVLTCPVCYWDTILKSNFLWHFYQCYRVNIGVHTITAF